MVFLDILFLSDFSFTGIFKKGGRVKGEKQRGISGVFLFLETVTFKGVTFFFFVIYIPCRVIGLLYIVGYQAWLMRHVYYIPCENGGFTMYLPVVSFGDV